ncbi:MAG: hypothetical protein K0U52_05530, partial [Gammaproteobacteria bacterium]|nr:hypothetical protein [Gammaproteobacteria bacterium]
NRNMTQLIFFFGKDRKQGLACTVIAGHAVDAQNEIDLGRSLRSGKQSTWKSIYKISKGSQAKESNSTRE